MSPERQRLEAAYAEHAGAVLAFARRRTDSATADDVLSEVFLAAWRRIDELPAAPRPWLLGVARKVLANQRRSGERQAAVGERVAAHTPLATPGPAEGEDGAVLRALGALGPGDRELLLLIAWDGLTPREAASVLGTSAAACSMRLTRARRRLAAALAAADGDGGRDDDGSSAPIAPAANDPSGAHTAAQPATNDIPAAPLAPISGVDALARLVAAAPPTPAGWRFRHA